MGDGKLNTAEHDHRGRCIRHPDIRLRKKKLLGGWKILIGHCPECCLDEMRRVRDEIEGADRDSVSGAGGGERRKKSSRKEKESKEERRAKRKEKEGRSHRTKKSSSDQVSLNSEGYHSHHGTPQEIHRGHHHHGSSSGRHHHQHRHREDEGSSEATGSTAQMSGNSSVVSEQYISRYGHDNGMMMSPMGSPTPSYNNNPHATAPSAVQRTMVLSMAFTDPTTGQRGTYTGQVNSINHKPDGKGTVYYNNGMIAEGEWRGGLLLGDDGAEDEGEMMMDGGVVGGGEYGYDASGRGTAAVAASSYYDQDQRRRDRSLSREAAGGGGAPRSRSRGPPAKPHSSGGDFSGNLHRLDKLGGASRSRPRGGSASVQSYNSRGSYAGPSGSASVQIGYSGGSVANYSVGHYASGGGDYHQRQAQSFHGVGQRTKRGEYEP
ncbi:predicted protein [Thalassiosira pseudonana CCMP1335]|uniref:Uncharacterized protein n=1 Tax=Thalassiosira pseudonana TaxID=35128 RepID=B8BR27_THAPS|nr:predicted protein [Thalassiosira pseudonana CCMP1335]EED96459.1 predicted protein [Thalassiosira pseudonana CCMP1335]|eukprot:scaffold5185_cov198-Alexandrium_tamarense.AAC.37